MHRKLARLPLGDCNWHTVPHSLLQHPTLNLPYLTLPHRTLSHSTPLCPTLPYCTIPYRTLTLPSSSCPLGLKDAELQFLYCFFMGVELCPPALNKPRSLSPRVNYTDRAIAACRRSYCQLLRMEVVDSYCRILNFLEWTTRRTRYVQVL
jgi:hypothetical protein